LVYLYVNINETEMITLQTKIAIGFKYEVKTSNGIKVVGNKNRQFLITLENDLYSVHAFTLRGVNMVNESKVNGIFGNQLNETIRQMA
jgi:hypothetical protein